MSALQTQGTTDIDRRLGAVPRPEPVMSRETAERLSARQQELLGELTELIADGFSNLTMADLAAELGCSLRTLYGIADSRDGLVLVACDRNLWAIGRLARSSLDSGATPALAVESVRSYLTAATEAVSSTTAAFSLDLAAVPGGPELRRSHSEYLIAMTTELLDIAIEQHEIAAVESAVIARAMAGVSSLFIDPEVIDTLPGTPKDAADQVVEILLRGLAASPD